MAYDYSGAITAKVKAAKKNRLKARMSWGGKGRGYEFPEELISAIKDPEYQLAARLQLEGGVRAEGVGFPRSQFSKAVLTLANLHGIVEDPLFSRWAPCWCSRNHRKGRLHLPPLYYPCNISRIGDIYNP